MISHFHSKLRRKLLATTTNFPGITVACRDGKIYSIKNGSLLSVVIELETQVVGLQEVLSSLVRPGTVSV